MFFGYINDMIPISVNEKVGFQQTETRKITNTTKNNCYITELLVKDVKKTISYVLLRQRLAKRSTIASKAKNVQIFQKSQNPPKRRRKAAFALAYSHLIFMLKTDQKE